MTIIAAVVQDGEAWMIADRDCFPFNDYPLRKADPKICRPKSPHGAEDSGLLLGVAGNVAAGLLMRSWKPEASWNADQLTWSLHRHLSPAPSNTIGGGGGGGGASWTSTDNTGGAAQRLLEFASASTEDPAPLQLAALLATREAIYMVDGLAVVTKLADSFAVVGCGEDLARGVLWASHPSRCDADIGPELRLVQALECAAEYHASVREPFDVLHLAAA